MHPLLPTSRDAYAQLALAAYDLHRQYSPAQLEKLRQEQPGNQAAQLAPWFHRPARRA